MKRLAFMVIFLLAPLAYAQDEVHCAQEEQEEMVRAGASCEPQTSATVKAQAQAQARSGQIIIGPVIRNMPMFYGSRQAKAETTFRSTADFSLMYRTINP